MLENRENANMSVIRAIEIGYGTTSFTKDIKNGNPIVETFSSNVALKNGSDLSGGLSRKNTIDIEAWRTIGAAGGWRGRHGVPSGYIVTGPGV